MLKSNGDLVDLDETMEFEAQIKFASENVPRRDVPNSFDKNVCHRIQNLILEQVRTSIFEI